MRCSRSIKIHNLAQKQQYLEVGLLGSNQGIASIIKLGPWPYGKEMGGGKGRGGGREGELS